MDIFTAETESGAVDHIGINETTGGEVVASVAVERIIAQRNAGLTQLYQAAEQFAAGIKLLKEASGKSYLPGESDIIDGLKPLGDLSRFRRAAEKTIDRSIWARLMQDTGMLTLMSGVQREAWDNSLYSDDCPVATLDNGLC